jgi:hypothetical protein
MKVSRIGRGGRDWPVADVGGLFKKSIRMGAKIILLLDLQGRGIIYQCRMQKSELKNQPRIDADGHGFIKTMMIDELNKNFKPRMGADERG